MFKQKFRIKHVNNIGFFPQVRKCFFWYKIVVNDNNFYLYPNSDIDYPKSRDNCLLIIKHYKKLVKKDRSITYENIGYNLNETKQN